MGSSRPGKFPAEVVGIKRGLLVLDASSEDLEYLVPFIGKVVTVDITPSGAPSEPPAGGGTDEGQAAAVSGG